MSQTIKARGDSKLKTLPPKTQEKLYEWLCADTITAVQSRVREELGISTSQRALSEFYSWYSLRLSFSQAQSISEEFKAQLLNRPDLAGDAERVNSAAQILFETLAVQKRDAKLFTQIRLASQRDRQLDLEARRMALLESKVRAAADEVKKLRQPGTDISETQRNAILDKVDEILGIKK
jgi:hypothetical protein